MKIGLDLPAHRRVFAAFFLFAFCLGSLYPRLPDIQRAMGVGEGALGFALMGVAAGTMLSLTFGSSLVARIGHRRTLLTALPVLAVLYAVAVWARTPALFFALLFPIGVVIGAIELIINLEADRVEHATGRRIMNRAHAFWSFGFFSAGMLSAGIAQTGLSPQWHLAIMVPVVALAVALALGRFQPARHRVETSEPGPRFARPTLAIFTLVCVTISAMVMEGAGFDWSAIYMRNVFAAAPFWAGFAVALGAGVQACARFFADGVVERYSPVAVARGLLCILGMGALLVFFAPAPWIALAGFAFMGVGTSAIFPLAVSAAAQRTDRPAAINVAALAQTSFVAFLLGPPALGFVAQHCGIRWAFGVGLPLVALSLLTVGALSPRRRG